MRIGRVYRPHVRVESGASAIGRIQPQQPPPQQPPPALGAAEGAVAAPPRPVTATVDSNFTVSS
jgi:hypothetical protein